MVNAIVVPLLTILFGIAVIVFPKFLRFILGGYFILIGLIGLLPWLL